MTKPEDAPTVEAVGTPLEPPVRRLEPERLDPALQDVVRRLWEAPPGTPITVPREAIAAAEAPLREALARELAEIRRRERRGCFECAWGRVCGCWRCGGR